MIIQRQRDKFFYADVDAQFHCSINSDWVFYDNYEAEDIEISCAHNKRTNGLGEHIEVHYFHMRYCGSKINDN